MDLSIDKTDRLVPSLGLLTPVTPTSGRLALFTDSSCLDTSSASLTKCFWLLEKLVTILSSSGEESVAVGSSMMSERYRLPEDYTANERVKRARVEDMEGVEVYRQGRLHSAN